MSIRKEIPSILYTCASERDNPFDPRTRLKEHAAWREAYWAVRLECGLRPDDQVGEAALKEDAGALQGQRQFALVWRPFFRRFRLRVNDVIRVDNNRLGRVIRVTECAAVVLMNPPTRVFKTRFDRPVQFRPGPVTFRISANAEAEVLNRKPPKKRKPERRVA